jgi:hypothetical protein
MHGIQLPHLLMCSHVIHICVPLAKYRQVQVKVRYSCPCPCYEGIYGGRGTAPLILMLVIGGGEWSTTCPGHFTSRAEPLHLMPVI